MFFQHSLSRMLCQQAVVGVPGARLVRMADDYDRQCSRKYAPRGSTTAFSDGFPLLLANEVRARGRRARS